MKPDPASISDHGQVAHGRRPTLSAHIDIVDVNEAQTDFWLDGTSANENVPTR
ncbi:MAG: hypothetical protein R3D05_10100 [Dongiaceae bacterium]